MTTTPTKPRTDVLTDDMLARFDERAAIYDRENRFFDEDWAELRDSGYLLAAVVMVALLPSYDEVPADFPASVLYQFRLGSLAVQLTLWGVLGVVLAELVHRLIHRQVDRTPHSTPYAEVPR